MQKLDGILIDYLENKYAVSQNVKTAVEKLIAHLRKGSICVKIDEELEQSWAIGKLGEARPLILDDGNLYIQKYWVYQNIIIEKIREMLDNETLFIISGGPGTGKTTGLAKILREKLNSNDNLKILLAAPTGKAAFRMNESLKKQAGENDNLRNLTATTIHRLLGYRHLSAGFRHNKQNPLDADIVVVDECSMIDLPMTAKLLSAIREGCELFMLGDKNQLASVEAGSVFADICEALKENMRVYVEKTESFRAKDAPGIINLSREILSKGSALEKLENENVIYREKFIVDDIIKRYDELFFAKNKEDALRALENFQILCATKTGRFGSVSINKKIRSEAEKREANFFPVIISRNDYSKNLFNGDIGVCDREQNVYFGVDNSGRERVFAEYFIPPHEDAFAITIHKSQGSEYNCVAVVYPERENDDDDKTVLTRELLYTAITRAKKECLLFGKINVLRNSLARKVMRASGIKEKLKQG